MTTALVVSNNVVLSITLSRLGHDVLEGRPRESGWLAKCPNCDVVLLDVGRADRATKALDLIRQSYPVLPVVVIANDTSDWSAVPAAAPETIVLRDRISPAVLQSVLEKALWPVTQEAETPPRSDPVATAAIAEPAVPPIVIPAVPKIPQKVKDAVAGPPEVIRPSTPERAQPVNGAAPREAIRPHTPERAQPVNGAAPPEAIRPHTPDRPQPVNGAAPSTWVVVSDDVALPAAIDGSSRGITVAKSGDRWLGLLPGAKGVVLDFTDSDAVFAAVRNIRRRGFDGPIQALWEDPGGSRAQDRVRVRRFAIDLVPLLVERLSAVDATTDLPDTSLAGGPAEHRNTPVPTMRIVVVSTEPSLSEALCAVGFDASTVHADERQLFSGELPDVFVVDVTRYVVARRVLARFHAEGHARPVLVAWRDGSAGEQHFGGGDNGRALAPTSNGTLFDPAGPAPAFGPPAPTIINLVDRPTNGSSSARVTVPQMSVDAVEDLEHPANSAPRRSRRKLLPSRSHPTPSAAHSPPDAREEVQVLVHALEAVDTFVSLHEVALALVTEAGDVAHADAVALLVRNDTDWLVEAGVALRTLEQRQVVSADAWLIQQSVGRQLAVVIEDSDQTRWQLEGIPTSSHKFIAAVPVAGTHALLLVGQDSEPFSEDVVTQLVALAAEAGPLVQRGVLLRTVASRFGQYRP